MSSLKTHVPEPRVKIWHIIDGPFGKDDVAPEDWLFGLDERYDECVYLIAKIECDGVISEADYWFQDLNTAYEVVKKLKVQIEPLEMSR